MKAKSILLTVPLAVSALTFLTLPANAVCWSWQPCADQPRYGYAAPTESQAVLPPLPADGKVPPGSTATEGEASGATAAPAAPTAKPKPAKKPAATATAAPQPAPAAKPKSAPAPAQAAAPPPAAPVPAQAKVAPPPACAGPASGASACACAGHSAQKPSPQPRTGCPSQRRADRASRRKPAAPAYACASQLRNRSTGTSGSGSPATTSGSCTQRATCSGGSARVCTGHDADGARHGDHAGDPR